MPLNKDTDPGPKDTGGVAGQAEGMNKDAGNSAGAEIAKANNNASEAASAQSDEAHDNKSTFDPKEHTGFHVMKGKTHLGTYQTEEDAQSFIDQHLEPQEIKAKIVHGEDPHDDQ